MVSNFSRVLQSSQEKSKTMVTQSVGGVNEVHYGLYKNGELYFLSFGGGILNVIMVNNSFQFVNEDNDVNVRWKRTVLV